MARVVSVNISEAKGVPKREVPEIRLVVGLGVEGDAHAGSWHRQVSLLAEESVDRMRALGLGNLAYGAFGENIDTVGLDLCHLPVGSVLRIGGAALAVTQIGKTCHGDGCAIKSATGQCVMPTDGVFAVVICGGIVRAGDEVVLDPVRG